MATPNIGLYNPNLPFDISKIPYVANDNQPRSEEEIKKIMENAAQAYRSLMDSLEIDWRNDPDLPVDIVKIPYANNNHPRSEEEINKIIDNATKAYEIFMDSLGFDWRNDPNSRETPGRVAKAFVRDFAWGCYSRPPDITAFDNVDKYDGMVAQTYIEVNSLCSHHHATFSGFAHVAYIPSKSGKVIGLSKLNRIVDWYSRRPQVQENLTMQIHDYINKVCTGNKGVAVYIEANHTCCSLRGVRQDSAMRTAKLSGDFESKAKTREEFYLFASSPSRPRAKL